MFPFRCFACDELIDSDFVPAFDLWSGKPVCDACQEDQRRARSIDLATFDEAPEPA